MMRGALGVQPPVGHPAQKGDLMPRPEPPHAARRADPGRPVPVEAGMPETVELHHLRPGSDKVTHEHIGAVAGGVVLRERFEVGRKEIKDKIEHNTRRDKRNEKKEKEGKKVRELSIP